MEKHKFDLGKGSDKKFDLSKNAGRKFDLAKENEEPEAVVSAESTTSNPVSDSGSKKKWPYIVGIFAVIILIILGLSKCGNDEQNVVPENSDKIESEAIDSVTTDDPSITESTEDVIEELDSDSSTEPETEVQMPSSGQEVVSNTDDSSDVSITSEPVAENMSLNDNVEPVSSNIEQKALSVIRGEFGDGLTRRNNLGAEYDEIQKRVNEMYKQGLVY